MPRFYTSTSTARGLPRRNDNDRRPRLPGLGLPAMRMLAIVFLLAASLAQVSLDAAVADAQGAAQTWEVQAGGGDNPSGPPVLETQAFFPDPVTIRAGDTVNWTIQGFHTVTFNSNRTPRPLIVPGTAPGELVVGPAFFPVGPTGPNASYDGTAQASSGVPEDDAPGAGAPTYRLTFPRPGVYGYVCEIHPGMSGTVEVLAANAQLPETPAQARARGDLTRGALLTKMREDVQSVTPVVSGPIHTALVGLGNGFGASALQFLPGNITLRRGEYVIWAMPDPFEIHTVTFTSGAPPPEFVQPQPQPSGPPRLLIPANVASPAGGQSYTGQGYANSGIMTNGDAYALRFDAPAGTYDFLCLVHPFMTGRITVTD